MWSPRTGSPRRPLSRQRRASWAALAVGWILSSVGCQVEYAGMTLPSGKYMHDDVQYFAPGPQFPWANTNAATQRARMQAMGIEPVGGGMLTAPVPPGMLPPEQSRMGRPQDINASPLSNVPTPGVPGTGIPGPGGGPPPDVTAPTVPEAVPPPGSPMPSPSNEAVVPGGPPGPEMP